MCYYHIDRNQRYIQSLGWTKVNNRRIQVDPHGSNGLDNGLRITCKTRAAAVGWRGPCHAKGMTERFVRFILLLDRPSYLL